MGNEYARHARVLGVVLIGLGVACSKTVAPQTTVIEPPPVAAPPPLPPTPCSPNTTRACFVGDANMAGVGACIHGTQKCKADGSDFEEACEGQGAPSVQRCGDVDDDCDGVVGCTGELRWAEILPAGVSVKSVKADASGNVYFAGEYSSTVSVLGTTLPGVQQGDAFLGKFDPTGKLLWLKPLASVGTDLLLDMIVVPGGVVTATTYATGDQGDFVLGASKFRSTNIGTLDVIVAKFDDDGNPAWGTTFVPGTGSYRYGTAKLALGLNGSLFLAMWSELGDVSYRYGTAPDLGAYSPLGLIGDGGGGARQSVAVFELASNGQLPHPEEHVEMLCEYPVLYSLQATPEEEGTTAGIFLGVNCHNGDILAPNPRSAEPDGDDFVFRMNYQLDGTMLPDWTSAAAGELALDSEKRLLVATGVNLAGGRRAIAIEQRSSTFLTLIQSAATAQATGDSFAWSVAGGVAGTAVVGATCDGAASFDFLRRKEGDVDGKGLCVLKYLPDGHVVWVRTFEAPSANIHALEVDVAPSGAVAFGGTAGAGKLTFNDKSVDLTSGAGFVGSLRP